jgi:CHAT domain-containing protein
VLDWFKNDFMIKCLYKFINVVIFLSISYHACSQNLPIETNKIIENFKLNFEQNEFKSIIEDYEKIKSEKRLSKFKNDEIVLIRYFKFCSEIYLGNFDHFDDSNFNELLKNINRLKKDTDEKKSYLVCINNTIIEVHQRFPELSIKLSEKILNFKDYYKLSSWEELKYSLLLIQLNSYNRLDKFKEVENIRLQLETFNKNDPSKKLTLLLEKASYNIKISQFEIAHKFLKAADSLLTNSKHGISASDSIGFSIVWAKFFEEQNDIQNAKQYYFIAFKIAEFNNLVEKKYQLIFELSRLESDNKLKIKTLENLLTDKNCNNFHLKLAILNSLVIAYGSEGLNKKAIDKLLILYDLENKYFEKVNKITVLNLAYYFEKDKQFKESEKYYSIAYSDLIKKISSNFIFLSNSEKSSYLKKESRLFNSLNTYNVKAYQSYPKSSELSFNANLISKSLILETTRELEKVLIQSSDKKLRLQFNKMIELRKLISKMQSEGSTQKEIIERYNQQADSLDKILVNKVGEYANAKRKFEITWKDVQANLSSTEAAIEFARYYNYEEKTYEYMALVVRPEYEYPKLVKLGSEVKIKSACSQKEFPELYNYVWRGIDSLLYGVKTIYYSPVGELNNISFSALIYRNSNEIDSSKSNWSYLIDKYDLRQLTTTRYLADGTLNKKEQMAHSIKLIGGVNYTDLPTGKDSVEKTESTEDLALHINLQNELKHSNIDRGGKINYLKGSEIEVKEIVNTLKSSNWETTVLDGKSASEYQLKKELEEKSPGIIHISTHGFAFPEKETKERNNFEAGEKLNYKISDDPMVRCGLMLSGANISWSGDPKKMIKTSGDDGILTAAEVANLDLSNTKLVVLSACETGLGKIESSEGTFGLKRGFKLAGVDQIIVSLWKVPDNETKELMTLFYSELSKTENIDLSFNNAQKEMRNRYPFEPEKWAGFVLVR